MKILYHHRTLGDGAEGIHIEEMINAFRKLNHIVKVISPIGEATNCNTKSAKNLENFKKKIPRVIFEIMEILYTCIGFFKLTYQIFTFRPAFIYERYITFNASGVLVCLLFGIPIILEVNAPLALERRQQPDEKLILWRLANFFEKWICSHSSKVVCVSTPLKNYLLSINVPEHKIFVLPNGVNLEKFNPIAIKEQNELRIKLGIELDDIVIGFVGIMRPWHGVELLVEAYSRLIEKHPKLYLLIIGDGPIQNEIESNLKKLKARYYITGRLPHKTVAFYTNIFDIAVSPRATFYASPMKIIEYMAIGKPIIAPDSLNIRDILTDNVNGILFEPNNVSSLVTKLDMLIENPEKRTLLASSAQQATTSTYNWINNAQVVLNLVNDGKKAHNHT